MDWPVFIQVAMIIGILPIGIPLLSLTVTAEPGEDGELPDSYWHSMWPFWAGVIGLLVANLAFVVWVVLFGEEWYRREGDRRSASRQSG